jgi:hypothetical protein
MLRFWGGDKAGTACYGGYPVTAGISQTRPSAFRDVKGGRLVAGFFEVEFAAGVVDGAEGVGGGFGETAERAGDVGLDDVEVAACGAGPLP